MYLVPKSWLLTTIFHQKEIELLGEMAYSISGTGNVWDKPRIPCCPRKQQSAQKKMRIC